MAMTTPGCAAWETYRTMPGPTFLWVYVCSIAAVIALIQRSPLELMGDFMKGVFVKTGLEGKTEGGGKVEADFLLAADDPMWVRVRDYPLDPVGYEGSFRKKLARETGCSYELAGQAMVEYKRFIYLCARSERMLTPSELVDHAWHQHLLDTKRYWQDFCVNALGKPIHHEPERGAGPGKKEEDPERFKKAYEHTMTYYRRVFGEAADAEVWPGVEERFGRERFVRVDRWSHWLVPRRILGKVFGRSVLGGALLAMALTGVGCQAWQSFKTMPGPDFLVVYMMAAVGCVALYAVLEVVVYVRPVAEPPTPDVYGMAYMVGGGGHVVHTALVSLRGSGWLTQVSPMPVMGGGPAGGSVKPMHDVEKEVLGLCRQRYTVEEIQRLMRDRLRLIDEALVERDYLMPAWLGVLARWTPVAGLMGLMAAGGYRVYLGMQSGKPYFYLAIMLGVSAVVLFAALWRACKAFGMEGRRTQSGKNVLERFWKTHYPVVIKQGMSEGASSEALGWGFALFGPAALLGVTGVEWVALGRVMDDWSEVSPPVDPMEVKKAWFGGSSSSSCGGMGGGCGASCSGGSGCGSGCGGGCGGGS